MTKQSIVVLDSETNGLSPKHNYGIVDIGMVKIVDGKQVDTYQKYINQPTKMSKSAQDIHGITDEFLADKPTFNKVVDEILDFIGDSVIIAHNAAFDMRHLNEELKRCGLPPVKNKIIDTLKIARAKRPKGSKNTLDVLCEEYNIDLGSREKHSALLDARMLAEVCKHLLNDFNYDSEEGLNMAEELENDFGLLPVTDAEGEIIEYDARLVYFGSCGVQKPHPKYPDNPPREQVAIALEVIGATRVYNNEKLPKILWTTPYNKFDTLTERGKELPLYSVFVPNAKEGDKPDWESQLSKPCSITISHHKNGDNTYDNIASITAIPAKYRKDVGDATTTPCYSDDCEAQNDAQAGMFGLTRYLWEQRIKGEGEAPAKPEPAKQQTPKQEDKPASKDTEEGADDLDDQIPF